MLLSLIVVRVTTTATILAQAAAVAPIPIAARLAPRTILVMTPPLITITLVNMKIPK